jgi:protein SCO1
MTVLCTGSGASWRLLVLLCATAALAACKPAQFNSVDITGAPYAQNFVLTDQTGQRRTLADYHGKVAVVFFGFTQCPDVCPTTLADMAAVKKRLGADGNRLQVLFVTLDPERDTPAVLAQYVAQFDPSFVGLTGTPDEIARTAKDFKVFFQKVPGKTPTSYTIDHTTGSYAFDREGRVRLLVKHGQGVEPVVADLKRLL